MSTIKRMGGLVLRETTAFRLVERRGRYWLSAKSENAVPRCLRVGRDAAHQLSERISLSEFDGACIFTGCGVFQK